MGFPRGAPMKPHEISWKARYQLGGGMLVWTFGLWAVFEFYFDCLSTPMRRKHEAALTADPRFLQKKIEADDRKAQLMAGEKHRQSSVTASQMRTAGARLGEMTLENEVREFFMKKNEKEKETNQSLDDLKPGIHGQIVFTRSTEKEKEIAEKTASASNTKQTA